MEEGYKDIREKEVEDKTGKTFDDWIDILEGENADPDEIIENAAYLQKEYSVTPWWARAISVRYEYEENQ